jgi:hypothetical protein
MSIDASQLEQLSNLIERCEKAEGGSRELDFDIDATLAPPDHATHWQGMRVRVFGGIPNAEYDAEHPHHRPKGSKDENPSPRYTSSVDAAIALVEKMLPEFCPGVVQNVHHKHWVGSLQALRPAPRPIQQGATDLIESLTAIASTPALALCLALLSALKSLRSQLGAGQP